MSDSIFPPRPKKEPLQLQLTAMIDVFSMIVIFLIFGTVFGAADMVIPNGLEIPKSLSKEGIDSAPRLLIHQGQVSFTLDKESIPLASFTDLEARKKIVARLTPLLEQYQKRRKGTAGAGMNPINLVADQSAPYHDVFDVVSLFRELGFDSIYFVATGGSSK
jgi:biopolymer transport protein ExbD